MRERKQVSLGSWILSKADKFCRDRDIDLSGLIEQSLKHYIDDEKRKEIELYGQNPEPQAPAKKKQTKPGGGALPFPL